MSARPYILPCFLLYEAKSLNHREERQKTLLLTDYRQKVNASKERLETKITCFWRRYQKPILDLESYQISAATGPTPDITQSLIATGRMCRHTEKTQPPNPSCIRLTREWVWNRTTENLSCNSILPLGEGQVWEQRSDPESGAEPVRETL